MSDLSHAIGQHFVKQRHGAYQRVVLERIRKDRVVLREPGHQDSFTLPIRQFEKFFALKPARNASD